MQGSGHAPLFVLGTGRCVSTLISDVLRAHPRILSLSEFFTVCGREKAFTPASVDGPQFWDKLVAPSPRKQ